MSRDRIIERRLHQECNYQNNLKMDVHICAICCVTIPSCSQRRSLNPEASAANKRVVDFLVSVINPDLELAGGAGTAGGTRIWYCCKPCFSKLERAKRSLEAVGSTARQLVAGPTSPEQQKMIPEKQRERKEREILRQKRESPCERQLPREREGTMAAERMRAVLSEIARTTRTPRDPRSVDCHKSARVAELRARVAERAKDTEREKAEVGMCYSSGWWSYWREAVRRVCRWRREGYMCCRA